MIRTAPLLPPEVWTHARMNDAVIAGPALAPDDAADAVVGVAAVVVVTVTVDVEVTVDVATTVVVGGGGAGGGGVVVAAAVVVVAAVVDAVEAVAVGWE